MIQYCYMTGSHSLGAHDECDLRRTQILESEPRGGRLASIITSATTYDRAMFAVCDGHRAVDD